MVIVRLIGGLGNQMFQYAAGRSLALRHGTTLKLDISGFEQYPLRRYSLGCFNICEEFATPEEVARLKSPPRSRLVRLVRRAWRKLTGPTPYYRQPVFYESMLHSFDPNIWKTPKHVYLDGYWQSEKYFKDIEQLIRDEFTIRIDQDSHSRKIAAMIAATNSVSIHVRRGDYVSNPVTNRVHGVCELEYYMKCVHYIEDKVESPDFFVFSDDPDWVVENLRLPFPMTFVTHNGGGREYEDLRLMSLCKHHIIANSSFSWWGAWLNANSGKVVLAPWQWFNDRARDTRDLLPDSWIKV